MNELATDKTNNTITRLLILQRITGLLETVFQKDFERPLKDLDEAD